MKNIYIFTLIILTSTSCGKTNRINTKGDAPVISKIEPAKRIVTIESFEGTYDLIDMKTDDCGASVEIIKDCDGLILFSNHHSGPEEFCRINKPERINEREDRNSRNLRPGERFEDSRNNDSKQIVTLSGNELKSVLTINIEDRKDRRWNDSQISDLQLSFTNSLILNEDGTLAKISNFKTRESRCLYLKR